MMTEIFEVLEVIGNAVSDEDRVVYLLASLPESFHMLVTSLEAQSESVPKWEVVTQILLHEELKIHEKATTNIKSDELKALAVNGTKKPKKSVICYYCRKPGHIKRECKKYLASKNQLAESAKADNEAIVTIHAFSATSKNN